MVFDGWIIPCSEGLYGQKSIQACIFRDGDVLPDFDVRKNMKVIMAAVWENLD